MLKKTYEQILVVDYIDGIIGYGVATGLIL